MSWFNSSYKEINDEALMVKIQNGDHKAFEELYDRYAEFLFKYFFRRLWKDKEKSEDFVQDVFTKIIQNPESFDSGRSFKTWIFSIANNMTINEYKKQEVRKNTVPGLNLEAERVSSDQNPLKNVENKIFKEALEKELGRLDEKHRTCFELRHINGFSNKEVAEMLGISEGTVKSRLFNAIKNISEALKVFQTEMKMN